MEIGLVGLPRSGKTTVFNAVTRGHAQVAVYSGAMKPNIGVAKVPDPNLERLQRVFGAQRTVAAEETYVDVPGPTDGADGPRGVSGEYLGHLQRADALVLVARGFDDPSVLHEEGGVDPVRDVETMLFELAASDAEVLVRRLKRLADGFKGARASERDALSKEQALLDRLKSGLEAGAPLRHQATSPEEARLLEGFGFLTAKPVVVVLNVDEGRLSELQSLERQLASALEGRGVLVAALCGKLEMELAQMEPEEERDFRESLRAGESGLERMVSLTYSALDLVSFYTGNRNEVRAWAVAKGTPALKAAGKVHSDLERGFVRAEVIGVEELLASGTLAEARRRGLLRREGKGYPVRHGDVVNVLFSV